MNLSAHQVREEHRYSRDVGNEQQNDENRNNERPDLLDHFIERDARNTAAGEEVDADGRGDKTEREVNNHDRTEVDRVDTELLCNGEEDGAEDVECGVCVDEAAGNDKDDIDHEQEYVLVAVCDGDERLARGGGDAGEGEDLAENGGARLARVGVEDVFGTSAPAGVLIDYYGLNAAGIAARVRRLLGK